MDWMDVHENGFLRTMDEIVKGQDTFAYTVREYYEGRGKSYIDHADALFKFNAARNNFVHFVETKLMEAGRKLGFNPRFVVKMDANHQIHITPRNGSAGRMLQRYENLNTMRELGRD